VSAMYYKEALRIVRALFYYAIVVGALTLIGALIHGGQVFVDASSGSHHGAAKLAHVQLPFSILFVVPSIAAAIFGSIAGISLSTENDGHLEVAWTRPASRLRYALAIFGTDIVAIVAAFALGFVGCWIATAAHGGLRYLVVDSDTGGELARYVLYPMAWFGLCEALTASVRSRGGAFAGFAWPIAFVLLMLDQLPLQPVWHAFFRFINYANPLHYASMAIGAGASDELANIALPVALTGLSAIAIIGIVLALMQWRRLEA